MGFGMNGNAEEALKTMTKQERHARAEHCRALFLRGDFPEDTLDFLALIDDDPIVSTACALAAHISEEATKDGLMDAINRAVTAMIDAGILIPNEQRIIELAEQGGMAVPGGFVGAVRSGGRRRRGGKGGGSTMAA